MKKTCRFYVFSFIYFFLTLIIGIIFTLLCLYFTAPQKLPSCATKLQTTETPQSTQGSQQQTSSISPQLPLDKDGSLPITPLESEVPNISLQDCSLLPSTVTLPNPPETYLVNANVAPVWNNETTEADMDLLTEFLLGEEVTKLEEKGFRMKVQGKNYTGWIEKELLLSPSDSKLFHFYRSTSQEQVVVTEVEEVFLYMYAQNSWSRLPLSYSTILPKLKEENGFTVVALPNSLKETGLVGFIDSNNVDYWKEKNISDASNTVNLETVIIEGKKFLGKSYVWGGTSSLNSVDCSGLWYLVFRRLGYFVPRDAQDQADFFSTFTANNPYQRGDLLYFGTIGENGISSITHTALHLGEGKILHATVQPSSQGVMIGDLLDGGTLVKAVRFR